jgi:hypothetical protein
MTLRPYHSPATLGDSVPKPLGFTAFSARMADVLGATGAAPPFRPLSRRSGRIPAFALSSAQVKTV